MPIIDVDSYSMASTLIETSLPLNSTFFPPTATVAHFLKTRAEMSALLSDDFMDRKLPEALAFLLHAPVPDGSLNFFQAFYGTSGEGGVGELLQDPARLFSSGSELGGLIAGSLGDDVWDAKYAAARTFYP